MLLQAPTRLSSRSLDRAEAVQLRRESLPQKDDAARVFGAGRQSSGNEQAVVLHFGSVALGLARRQEEERTGTPDAFTPPEAAPDAASPESDARAAASAGRASTAAAPAEAAAGAALGARELSADDRQRLSQLRQRDREVRTHEQAHKTAGGQHAGNIHLQFQVGPDGGRYAVEGEVPIDVSPVSGDPEATLRKMEIVSRAASAPASPSSADRAVAAQAARVSQQARAQLAATRYAQAQELVAAQ